MRRACRIYLNDLNVGKTKTLTEFLRLCHDAEQYFVDLFWQRQDFSGTLADLATIHQGRDRFDLTTRLAQALAKQAKEAVRSQIEKRVKRKPRLRRHAVTLYYHFVTVEDFFGPGFDWAVRFIGSGAPKNLVVPFKSTRLINERLKAGWAIGKTIRLGRDGNRLWIDLLLEKPRPAKRTVGKVLGMDSNYKAGFVFSDGEQVGRAIYNRIQQFGKRQKNTFAEIDAMVGQALKKVD